MAKTTPPPPAAEDVQFVPCPYCTIAIPSRASECPHCRQRLPAPGSDAAAERPRAAGRPAPPAGLAARYGRIARILVPVLAVLVALAVAYGRYGRYKVTVAAHPAHVIEASREKSGGQAIIRGTLRNEGDDIPDLSLRSIGVTAEFVYRDGRSVRKRVFPKTAFRGEGALLKGETGAFEFAAPGEGLMEVVLRSEIVELRTDRVLIPPGGAWRPRPGTPPAR